MHDNKAEGLVPSSPIYRTIQDIARIMKTGMFTDNRFRAVIKSNARKVSISEEHLKQLFIQYLLEL